MAGTVFIFPGQGSQYVGMAKDLFDEFNSIRVLFRQAEEILGLPITYQMFQGEEEHLRRTLFTQPAIFLHSAGILELLKEKGIKPDFVMGHSLGEVTALYAAEVLTFEEALRVVKKRAELMDMSMGEGGMSAVIGLPIEKIREIVDKFEDKLVIANINSPNQVVISGYVSALEKAEEELRLAGARRVIRLRVSGAFHSPLMKEAQQKFAEFLEEVSFRPPAIPVIPNVSPGLVFGASRLKEFLIQQLTGTVNWVGCVNTVMKYKPERFVEIGPKRVLSRLVKEIVGSEIEICSIDTKEDLTSFLERQSS